MLLIYPGIILLPYPDISRRYPAGQSPCRRKETSAKFVIGLITTRNKDSVKGHTSSLALGKLQFSLFIRRLITYVIQTLPRKSF